MRSAVVVLAVIIGAGPVVLAQQPHQNAVIDLWARGKPAFGVYAPNERQSPGSEDGSGRRGQPAQRAVYTRGGGETLAMNPLYDFVFLNLEASYDPAAVTAMVAGLRSPKAVGRKTLMVRIPPISRDGAEATRARVRAILDAGADGVTIPHIRNVAEAKQGISFFQDAKASVWSPSNPKGEKIAMLMLEDADAVAQAKAIADLAEYSILACGIGSLAQALGGDRAAAEAGTQKVLEEAKRAKLADMLTANTGDVAQRVKEGFLALLMQGAAADEAIALGRAAAGR